MQSQFDAKLPHGKARRSATAGTHPVQDDIVPEGLCAIVVGVLPQLLPAPVARQHSPRVMHCSAGHCWILGPDLQVPKLQTGTVQLCLAACA